MAGHPDDDYDRDILDIIPERFDADPDSYHAGSSHRLRNWLILGGAVLAVGVAVAVAGACSPAAAAATTAFR